MTADPCPTVPRGDTLPPLLCNGEHPRGLHSDGYYQWTDVPFDWFTPMYGGWAASVYEARCIMPVGRDTHADCPDHTTGATVCSCGCHFDDDGVHETGPAAPCMWHESRYEPQSAHFAALCAAAH